MRSGKLLATNDIFIELLVNDENYIINKDGTILTKITKTGKISVNNTWRPLTLIRKRSGGVAIKYNNKNLRLCRVIFRVFAGFLEKDLVINHIDGNETNNNFYNLELVTQSKNVFHLYKNTKNKPNSGNSKIAYEVAEKIRAEHLLGISYNNLRKKYILSKSTISYIINNKIWNNPSYRVTLKTYPAIQGLIQFTPSWVEISKLREIYKNKPKESTVDHIVPLTNTEVCGLHVPWNLQYLSREENRKKFNSFDGTNENESWRKNK